jgi:hypothetical protein
VNVQQAIFDNGQGEEKTDQQGIEAGYKEERIAKLKEIIRYMQDQADKEHGNNAPQQVEDLQPLVGNLGQAIRDDEVDDPPSEAPQTDQAQKEGQKVRLQGPFETEDVIEDGPDLQDPPDVDLEKEDERHQKGDRPYVQNGTAPSFEETGQFLGKNEGKMEEKYRKEEDPGEDDLHPCQGCGRVIAVDHDQFAGIPAYERKDQQGKDAIAYTLGVVKEDNQT